MKEVNHPKDRFQDLQEHPERYTDEQLDALLTGDAPAETLDTLATLKSAFVKSACSEQSVDVEAEWASFENAHTPQRHRRSWLKIAAMIAGVVATATLTYAAAVGLGLIGHRPAQEQAAAPSAPKKEAAAATTFTPAQKAESAEPTSVTFDNVELEKIMATMATYYHVGVVYGKENVKHVRFYFKWDKATPLEDNINILNSFQNINVTLSDNTITID
jgi:hypothetical protein